MPYALVMPLIELMGQGMMIESGDDDGMMGSWCGYRGSDE